MTAINPTIYLIKENITDPKKIFRKDTKLSSVTNGDVSLFYVKSKCYSPGWTGLINLLFRAFNFYLNDDCYRTLFGHNKSLLYF